jgi:ribosomal subunit interface protein
MQRNIEFRAFEPPKRVTTVIDRLASTLEKNTRTFSADAVYLRLMVEHNSARTLYRVSLTLDVPRQTLAAQEEQHDLQAGIRAAFEEVERQFEKYKANLRKPHRPPKRKIREATGI